MRKLLATLLGLLLPALAMANGYDVPNTNPRDLAMGGSVVADQQTAAAAFANPAALSKIEGLSLDLAGNILDIRSTWNAFNDPNHVLPSHAQTNFKPAPPPSLSVAYGTKIGGHGFGVGLSMNVPGGGNVFWPDNWPGRYRIITVDRKVYGFYLASGYEVCKKIRIGGGLVYYRTAELLKQAVDPAIPDATAELATSGGALSFDLSAEVKPFDDIPLTFGIDYKHQGVQNLTGDVHYANVPAALQAADPRLRDQSVTHQLTFPNALNVGAAYQLTPELLLTFGWTWNRYVIYDKDLFQGSSASVVVPRNYRNGWIYRLGAEWSVTEVLKLRAGILRDISGMPKVDGVDALTSPTYSPTLPDSNTWAAAVGAAYDITPALRIQGALWHAWMDEVRSTGSTVQDDGVTPRPYLTSNSGQPFPGLYQTHVWIYGVGIVYRWNPDR
jgi:long-chain fatty acid transport protein